ncbi:MAG: serine/threonine-protein kinase, partial [Polyangiaceae bacterium]
DVVRQETVALKIFASDGRAGGRDAIRRFEREIRALQALDHPNVVPMRDYFSDGPAIVLEWMSGGTLESMMLRQPIAPARAVEIAGACLSALGEAHRLDILHRDVKPANVLFDGAGVTRLGDFGVAHLGDLTATATAGVIGTLAYMSPEQRRGEPATVESDVYGVGAMLLEMLTGDPGARELAARKLPSGAHRDLDARHDALVLAMVYDDPDKRPRGALDARRALTSVVWPTTLESAAPVARPAVAARKAATSRLEIDASGRAFDTWIGRPVERLRLDDSTRARAAIFARVGHPSLQTIYRVDRAMGEVWLEALTKLDRAIEPNSRMILQEALTAMDPTKGSMRIEDAHVGMRADGELVLRFAVLQGSTIA